MNFKKPLKTLVAACCLLIATNSVFAQGVYVKFGGGYNAGIASASSTSFVANYTRDLQTGAITGGEEKAELVKINYGKGLTANAAIGYMFSKHLGTELDITYLNGGKNETTSSTIVNDRTFSEDIYRFSASAKMIYLQPSVVFATDLNGSFSAYGKFGAILAKGIIHEKNYSYSHETTRQTSEVTYEKHYRGGWGLGILAGLGLNYKLNEKISCFSELKISSLSYAPNQFKVENYKVNGEAYENSNPVYLVNKYAKNFSDPYSQNSAQIKQTFPFSTAGVNIGLKYNF